MQHGRSFSTLGKLETSSYMALMTRKTKPFAYLTSTNKSAMPTALTKTKSHPSTKDYSLHSTTHSISPSTPKSVGYIQYGAQNQHGLIYSIKMHSQLLAPLPIQLNRPTPLTNSISNPTKLTKTTGLLHGNSTTQAHRPLYRI